MSWVEKNQKINNRGGGGGTIIRDSRVFIKNLSLSFTIPLKGIPSGFGPAI